MGGGWGGNQDFANIAQPSRIEEENLGHRIGDRVGGVGEGGDPHLVTQ